jgi:intracellular septation protein
VCTTFSLLIAGIKQRRIAFFPLLAGLTILIPGSITIITDDPRYLINKDTWYNAVMGLAILGGLLTDKIILRGMFDTLFHITERGWKVVSLLWASMFGVLALSNYVIGSLFSEEAWLAYKMIATALTTIFALYLFTVARQHSLPGATYWGMVPAKK